MKRLKAPRDLKWFAIHVEKGEGPGLGHFIITGATSHELSLKKARQIAESKKNGEEETSVEVTKRE